MTNTRITDPEILERRLACDFQALRLTSQNSGTRGARRGMRCGQSWILKSVVDGLFYVLLVCLFVCLFARACIASLIRLV